MTTENLSTHQHEQTRKQKISFTINAIAAVLTFSMFVVRYALEGTASKNIFILPVAALIVGANAFVIKKWPQSMIIANHISLTLATFVTFLRTLASGGITSPVPLWFIIPSICAILIISPTAGLYYCILSSILLLIIVNAEALGIAVSTITVNQHVYAAVIIILIIFMAVVFYYYEKQRISNEEAIRAKERQLAEAQKLASIGSLSGGLSHELNNPLAIIKASLEVLKITMNKSGFINNELLIQLPIIDKNLLRIQNTVSSLKSLTRDDYLTDLKEIFLHDVIQEVQSSLNQNIRERLIIDLPLQPIKIKAVSGLLAKAIYNLILNSFEEISKSRDGWIKISVQSESPFVLSISDSGKGISPTIAAQMFNPFFTTKHAQLKTGMGLTLSQSIIQKHKGTLKYNSQSEHTEFLIEI